MKYLVVHPSQTGAAEASKFLDSIGEAKEYIEGILQASEKSEDQISIYELKTVNFQVTRVPVVKIVDEAVAVKEVTDLPKMDIADIPDIITTEEDVAEEQNSMAADDEAGRFMENNTEEKDNVEVFTFEN